ncbi:MAG TPA: selenium metabolism-associated LysR family transcriptional regulator [Candidatus Bathyarchaeia archaeon]
MSIRLDHLRTFITVSETGSFSKAAEELRISQGTASNHIAALEKFFDAKLFERTLEGAKLTEEGKVLLGEAKRVLEAIELVKQQLEELRSQPRGVIRLATGNIPGEYIIPRMVAEFKKDYPEADVEIDLSDSETSLRMLEEGKADMAAVGSLMDRAGNLETIEIAEERLLLIVPPKHELAEKDAVTLKEILKYPYINRKKTSGTRREVERILREAGISPTKLNSVLELGDTESIITAVSEGLGISILSSIAAKKAETAGLVKTLNILEVNSGRKLYIARIMKPHHPRLMEKFWDFAKEKKRRNP